MEYFKQGDRINGSYTIRPDTDLHSFDVICEFTEHAGFTIIKPENWPKNGYTFPEKSESRCIDPNCYHKKIEYGVGKDQIKVHYQSIQDIRLSFCFKALIGLSTICEQKIIHKCSFNILTGYSSWTGIDGDINNYWHGDEHSTREARKVM